MNRHRQLTFFYHNPKTVGLCYKVSYTKNKSSLSVGKDIYVSQQSPSRAQIQLPPSVYFYLESCINSTPSRFGSAVLPIANMDFLAYTDGFDIEQYLQEYASLPGFPELVLAHQLDPTTSDWVDFIENQYPDPLLLGDTKPYPLDAQPVDSSKGAFSYDQTGFLNSVPGTTLFDEFDYYIGRLDSPVISGYVPPQTPGSALITDQALIDGTPKCTGSDWIIDLQSGTTASARVSSTSFEKGQSKRVISIVLQRKSSCPVLLYTLKTLYPKRNLTKLIQRRIQTKDPRNELEISHIEKNSKTTGKNKRPQNIENLDLSYYEPLRKVPTSWGSLMSNGKPLFNYNEFGELNPDDKFTPSEILEYLYGQPADNFDQRCLWIQMTPADSSNRYPHAQSDRCRYKTVPSRPV